MKAAAALLLTLLVVTDIDSTSARRKSKSSDRASKDEVDDMICPPCDRLFCTVRKASKLKCKGGVTTDICGCCPVCAKQLGEPCGGEWNYLGKCDEGLTCQSTSSFRPPFQQSVMKTEIPRNRLPEGVCVEARERLQGDGSVRNGGPVTRQLQIKSTCQPKCTPDLCLKNPRAICSAIDVVDMKRDCHGQCQHTSCSACSWVNPEPDCGACSPDDFRCIKRFAKCIKRNYCTRKKFPCRAEIPESARRGKFQCIVPRCMRNS